MIVGSFPHAAAKAFARRTGVASPSVSLWDSVHIAARRQLTDGVPCTYSCRALSVRSLLLMKQLPFQTFSSG